jgi:uncharacterized protein
MTTREGPIYGCPCWVDLSTSDIGRATAFYTGLFGWEATESGEEYGHYSIVSKGDAEVGGMMQKTSDMEDMPEIWSVYFAVEDVAATLEHAVSRGAKRLFSPMQIGDMGSMVTMLDPTGAAVGLWQPDQFPGFAVSGEVGSPVWFELQTRDMAGAEAFYRDVFGMEVTPSRSPGGPPYSMLKRDGVERVGIFDMTGIVPEEVPAYWTVYFGVPDLDAALRYVQENGGTIITPKMEIGGRPWASAADPMGAPFVLMQM